jgi:hypothetical protein
VPAAPGTGWHSPGGDLKDPEGGGGVGPDTDATPGRTKSGGGGDRLAQGGATDGEQVAPADEPRMDTLLDHWNIPRPDVRQPTPGPAPAPADGPPVTAMAADQHGKGSPGPDGLTLLFSLLVVGFVAGGGYVGYRNWLKRYQPA